MIECDKCGIASEELKYYNTRFTSDGLYYSKGQEDPVLCDKCLKERLDSEGLSKIQSVVRVEETR